MFQITKQATVLSLVLRFEQFMNILSGEIQCQHDLQHHVTTPDLQSICIWHSFCPLGWRIIWLSQRMWYKHHGGVNPTFSCTRMMVKNIEVSEFLQLGWWPPEKFSKKDVLQQGKTQTNNAISDA